MDHQMYLSLSHQNQEQYYSNVSSSSISNKSSTTSNNNSSGEEEDGEMILIDLRRGPWTVEEDHTLMSYIAKHGEGRWNSLARCAGLKRTGKSCRLRWLNYLRPNVRRGNITLEEQLLILELHSHWGNRWSKIAQHLPGRTDNEIKNYWRTRVQKHAKQLKCDVNSKQFKDTMRYLWMPRLVERIQADGASGPFSTQIPNTYTTHPILNYQDGMIVVPPVVTGLPSDVCSENSSTTAGSSISFNTQVSLISDMAETHPISESCNLGRDFINGSLGYSGSLVSPAGYYHPQHFADFQNTEQNRSNNSMNLGCIGNSLNQWVADGGDNMWDVEDIWLLQQQHFSNNY